MYENLLIYVCDKQKVTFEDMKLNNFFLNEVIVDILFLSNKFHCI